MRPLASALFTALVFVACSACNQADSQNAGEAPVRQGAANKKEASPAFPGQTRAPERRSDVQLKVEEYATDLTHPWAMALLPDNSILVTERSGKLWRVTGQNQRTEVTGVPAVHAHGQGGLLDISLGPDFATNRTVYFTFAEPRRGDHNTTSLASARLSEDSSRLENVRVIFRQEPTWSSNLHFGSNIEWDSAGNMYLALGERSSPEARVLSQDLDTHLGKVLRLKPDGSPADGNPFIGQRNAKPEIWSYGHRNIQGAAIHPDTGKLWTVEHGPRGGDELNVPEAGKNYGWPVITYGIEYSGRTIGDGGTAREGMEQPIYYWDPVIAPGDMIFYRGDLFPWKDDLLIAGLGGSVVRLELDGERVTGEERVLTDQGRIRDIMEDGDGALWVVTDAGDGRLLKVTPAG